MKVIIGSYRGPAMVQRALNSLSLRLYGASEFVLVDDSGRARWADAYARMPMLSKVISLPRLGYGPAMQAVLEEAAGERFMFWEEDFILHTPTDLTTLGTWLDRNGSLAQVALQRNPWFPNELEVGSMYEALKLRLPDATYDLIVDDQLGFLDVHDATFTCNPAVWREGLLEAWPQTAWSENEVTRLLVRAGYRFGFVPGVRVTHDGERSGHGY